MKSKKLISVLCAVSMILAALPAASANEEMPPDNNDIVLSPVSSPVSPDTNQSPSSLVSPRITSYFDLDIPMGNDYQTLKSSAQLEKDQSVTVAGSWDPDYATLWVLLERADGSQWSRSVGLSCSTSYTFTIPATGKYNLKVSSTNYNITSGQLRVKW